MFQHSAGILVSIQDRSPAGDFCRCQPAQIRLRRADPGFRHGAEQMASNRRTGILEVPVRRESDQKLTLRVRSSAPRSSTRMTTGRSITPGASAAAARKMGNALAKGRARSRPG